MCLPGNIHLGIRADTQVRPYSVIIELFTLGVMGTQNDKQNDRCVLF